MIILQDKNRNSDAAGVTDEMKGEVMMTAQNCLEILRSIKDAAFATVDEKGLPQVRIIDVMLIEEEKLYFCTARGKDFYRQLAASGHVAVTGLNKEWQMVRLSGKAHKLSEQKKWIDRIFEENPSMNDIYPKESRYILEAFCIDNGQIEFFDLGKSPICRESFSLGNIEAVKKGFEITDACIGCGICKKNCPQQCISSGSPFTINQQHCLHCGLCRENCPVQAIQKRGV